MKKYAALLLALVMLPAALSGCAGKKPQDHSQIPIYVPDLPDGAAPTVKPSEKPETPDPTETPEPSEAPEPSESPAPSPSEAPTLDFADLPEDFTFCSGVGGWATELTLRDDGSFEGHYHDSDMGDTGEDYPNGTVYICDFTGKFTQPQAAHNPLIFSVDLEYLETDPDHAEGDEYYEDGFRYIVSGPYGMEDASGFLIYLPGIPVKELPEDFMSWVSANYGEYGDTLEHYGIYNAAQGLAFLG